MRRLVRSQVTGSKFGLIAERGPQESGSNDGILLHFWPHYDQPGFVSNISRAAVVAVRWHASTQVVELVVPRKGPESLCMGHGALSRTDSTEWR